jgi:hypothetical protein
VFSAASVVNFLLLGTYKNLCAQCRKKYQPQRKKRAQRSISESILAVYSPRKFGKGDAFCHGSRVMNLIGFSLCVLRDLCG